ncbi:MAG: antitermination protein NusG [Pirellulaceae bacterium]
MERMPILEQETSVFPAELLRSTEFEAGNPHRRWWAIFTKARNEKALARDLLGFGIPYYLPLVPRKNLVRRRVVHSHIPLFTGYVFLFGSEQERVQSLKTNRVCAVLDVEDQQHLRSDLSQVQQLVESGAPLTVEQRLKPGQPVRIKRGPFVGIEGVITQRRRGQQCLLVAVDFLQCGVSVEVDDFMVEPIR